MSFVVKVMDQYQQSDNKINLLIVDDDTDVADALRDLIELEADQFEVSIAHSGSEVISLLAKQRVDMVLLDIRLGRESGLDLITGLRAEQEDVCCIMMTAFRDASYVVEALKLGAADFLYKPIEAEVLIANLQHHADHLSLQRTKRAAESRFKAVFEHTFHWLFLVDEEGRVRDVNQGPIDYSDLSKTEILGKVLWELPWWQVSDACQSQVKSIIETALNEEFCCQEICMATQPESMMEILAKRVMDGESDNLLIVECRDITEKVKAKKILLQANEQLEERVRDRTKELEGARNDALRAAQEKEQLLSRMSHELRTPLNAILGYGQLMLLSPEQELNIEQRDSLHEIVRAGGQLLELVDEVLDISRIETGEHHFSSEQLDLVQELDSAVAASFLDQSEMQLTYENRLNVEANLNIFADRHAFQQVMLQLLSNAVKFNKFGGEICIDAKPVAGEKIRISVFDSGVGIAEENLERVFQPFDRLDTIVPDGVGMGLTIARKLIEGMGGSIGVNSKLGEGSEFWIELAQK